MVFAVPVLQTTQKWLLFFSPSLQSQPSFLASCMPTRSGFSLPRFLTFFLTYVVIGVSAGASFAQSQNVENLRIWHSPDVTRVVFDVSATMRHKMFELRNPARLVIDLEQANLSVSLPQIAPENRHIAAIRSGNPAKGVLRMVFDLKVPINVNSFILTPNELYGHRLVLDISDEGVAPVSALKPESEHILPADSAAVSSDRDAGPEVEPLDVTSEAEPTVKPVPINVPIPQRDTRFVVAIDAGHGGDDPGAIGYRRTQEKKLTFSIAKKLKDRINKDPRMRAMMVRTGDYFIELKDRRKKSRGADVFISIHADAFTKKSANGMSVFALSQRGATSAMASALAEAANASDLIGGVSLVNREEVVAKVLVDLSMTKTISESVNLGGRVLRELGKLGRLHSKRVEQANFSVLRSADIPSILVETGFITNPGDEKKLRSTKHQSKLANAIYTAVAEYYEKTSYASEARYASPSIGGAGSQRTTPSRTTPQKTTYGRHKVVRGDSLSTIAQQYGISLRELKRLNNIKHNTAMLGVTLKVPVATNYAGSVPIVGSGGNAHTGSVIHKVSRGDSLSKISARYNVTINAIKRANSLSRNTLFQGQKLIIPGVPHADYNQARSHKVRRGDTLSEIAQKYRSSISAIKKANKLSSNTVRLGQVLKIP